MSGSPGAGGSNPRKFSEKIALHHQKQAEETRAFEQLMTDLNVSRVNAPPVRRWTGFLMGWNVGGFSGLTGTSFASLDGFVQTSGCKNNPGLVAKTSRVWLEKQPEFGCKNKPGLVAKTTRVFRVRGAGARARERHPKRILSAKTPPWMQRFHRPLWRFGARN